MKKGIVILAIIPLILTMGIMSGLQVENFIQEAEAMKSAGTVSKNYGFRTNDKVCGDRLCSEVQPKESVTKYFGEERAVTNLDESGIKPCTREYMPVCGIDGKTYPNMCEMENGGTELAFEGTCEEPPITEVPEESKINYELEKTLVPVANGGTYPLTVTPVLGNPTKFYQAEYVPGTEELSEDEMRLIFCGTGLPYVTYAQASSCLVVQTGDGRSFLFDLGSGSIGRINSLKIPGDELTHVFASHLHTDHIGDLGPFWSQAYLSGRTVPIELYGPSGQNHELGTTVFVEKFLEAWKWDFETRNGRVMNSGMAINAHEFDFSKTHVIFEEDGFRVTSFPAVHGIDGSVSFRIDWNDLSVVFSGDTNTNTFLVENSQEADVVIIETFLPFEAFKEQFGFSEELYFGTVAEAHIPAERSGLFFSVVEPRFAVMYHQVVDERSIGQLFEAFRKGYSGPAIFAQDFTVINLTPEYIISRQANFDPSALPIPLDDKTATGTPNYFLSDWLNESVLYEDDLREMIAAKNRN